MKRIFAFKPVFHLINLFFLAFLAFPAYAEAASVSYAGHVEDIGWMNYVSDGETCGTTGQNKRLEAIRIVLYDLPETTIEYQAHCSDLGWLDYVQDNADGGVTGQSRRLEALRIRLSGAGAEEYDVYYRTHSQDIGWMGWAKNDEPAGTTGMAKKVEAIEVRLVPKGAEAPGETAGSYVENEAPGPEEGQPVQPQEAGVSYAGYVEDSGWQSDVGNGATAGTTGQAKKLFALKANLLNVPGEIQYNVFIQDKGWITPGKDGEIVGDPNDSLKLEAAQFLLAGEAADLYDVYYRVHCSGLGWLDWASNGASAGTINGNRSMEAFEIALVPKGAEAPGSTRLAFRDLNGKYKLQKATPGLRTVKNFLLTGLMPVGNTLYVLGGGWSTTGPEATGVHIGLYPKWKTFYDEHASADYDLTPYNYQRPNGLDCSGFVGWAVYNTLNTTSGGRGEVDFADVEAEMYARKGYGFYTPYRQVDRYQPGDIISCNVDGHVYISLGQCEDGSVVALHSTDPGVIISGSLGPNGEQTQATKLARKYMNRYYTKFYGMFSNRLDQEYGKYTVRTSKFTWDTQNFCGDPDGIRDLTPEQALQVLFNENE